MNKFQLALRFAAEKGLLVVGYLNGRQLDGDRARAVRASDGDCVDAARTVSFPRCSKRYGVSVDDP